jgi:hypothetical protein
VAGSDDLFFILIQYWVRDESIFLIEDNRHNIVIIILFQTYINNQLIKFIYLSKNKINENFLGEKEKTNKKIYPQKIIYYNYNNNNNINADDEPKYDNDNNINDNPRSDDNIFFDSKNNKNNNSTADEDINKYNYLDNDYNNNRINIIIIKNINKYYIIKFDEYK